MFHGMKRLLPWALLLGLAGPLASKDVTLRNKDGKALAVRLITCEGDRLTALRVQDGKQFVLDLRQLDDASREEVAAWIKGGGSQVEEFRIEVSSGKTGRKSGAEDFDDKNVNLDPLIVIGNPHSTMRTRPARVTAVFLGRPVNHRNAYYVFSSESFDLPSMPPGGKEAFQMKKISRNFDDRGYAKFGARYLGWVVLVYDGEDKRILCASSVPAALAAKFGAKILELKGGMTCDEQLRQLENIIVYSDN